MTADSSNARRLQALTRVAIVIGALLTLTCWSRSQVAGDQLNMLARGWLLIVEGDWIPFGLPTSAGGKQPGGFTAWVVGLPLWIWQHHRAPSLLVVLLDLAGFLMLDRIIRREMDPPARLLFVIVYWLNPWRLYHSGFLLNSNFMIPLGSLHFWAIYHQRFRPYFWPSFWHVLGIGLAAQMHVSVGLLVVLSILLWATGHFRFHWPAVAIATCLVLLSLIPWLIAVVQQPDLLPHSTSSHARLFQSGLSLARGLGYWLRYPALIASSTILCLDFGAASPALTGDSLRQVVQVIVGLFTLPLVLWANLRLWRGGAGWWRRTATTTTDFEAWLSGILRWSFVGTLAVSAVTPTTIMGWQLLTVFPVAVLPLVVLGRSQIARGRRSQTMTVAVTYAAICLTLGVAIAWASPVYRCGGDNCGAMNASPPALRSHHPMLEELGIDATCRYEVDVPGGWWPDVLPEN